MAEFSNDMSVARLLLAAAGQDLAACRLLATGIGIGDAVVGFHAQQAVEKSLKAVLSSHCVEFRRTHDLALLLDLLHDNHVAAPPEAHWLDELNPYAVEARYGTIAPEGLARTKRHYAPWHADSSAPAQEAFWSHIRPSRASRPSSTDHSHLCGLRRQPAGRQDHELAPGHAQGADRTAGCAPGALGGFCLGG